MKRNINQVQCVQDDSVAALNCDLGDPAMHECMAFVGIGAVVSAGMKKPAAEGQAAGFNTVCNRLVPITGDGSDISRFPGI